MTKKYTKPLITHIKIKDACYLLKITQSDLLQLAFILKIKTEIIKPNKIFNPLKKRQPFKKFYNNLLNTKLINNLNIENESTIIKRIDFNLETSLSFSGNECYKLKDINIIYNSKEYKILIENIKRKSEEILFKNKGRELIKKYKEFDYLNLILNEYKTLNEALSVLPKYLTILFLFKDILSNKNKYDSFIKNSKDILLSDIKTDELLLNNLLNYFINKIAEDKLLKFIYCGSNGYYLQLNIEGKNCVFLIPGKIEIKEPSAILFYNFKYGINLLKVILFKIYGDDTNKLNNVKIINSKYIFNSQHSNMLHLISRIYDLKIEGIVGEIVNSINKETCYIHPQYIFDSFNNSNMLLNKQIKIDINNYLLGKELPKQIYPFNKSIKEYSNLSNNIINKLSIKKQFLIEELKKEENLQTFFN